MVAEIYRQLKLIENHLDRQERELHGAWQEIREWRDKWLGHPDQKPSNCTSDDWAKIREKFIYSKEPITVSDSAKILKELFLHNSIGE